MDAADLARWTPISLIVEAPEPVLDWCDFSAARFTEPFFAMTIERVLQDSPEAPIVRTTLADLSAVEAAVSGRDPDGFMYHVSRCGSTLVSRLGAMLPDIAVVSEPEPLNALLELDPSTIREPALIECVRLLVRAFCRSRSETRVLFKLSSWNLRLASIIERAFPSVPTALVYREPFAVVASLVKGPPGWMKMRHKCPEQLAWLMGIVSAERLPDEAFAIEALRGFFEASLALDDRAPMSLIDYRQLPSAIWSHVLPFFGRPVNDAEVETLKVASQWHAKSPGVRFVADDASKHAAMASDVAVKIASELDPLYIELEARRVLRQQS